MKKIKARILGLRLNVKFTIVIIIFVLLPIVIFSMFLFRNMEKNVVNEEMKAMEYRMEKSYDQILKNVDAINVSTQFFLSDTALMEHLAAISKGQALQPQQLMNFYVQNISSLERMVNSNPYLYQIRVYVDSNTMQEMMPILYRESRMRQLAWADDDVLEGWKFNYTDTLFEATVISGNKEIVSLVTEVEDYREGKIGILEVAMFMEKMFPAVYEPEVGTWSCFADGEGNIYYNEEAEEDGSLYLAEIKAQTSLDKEKEEVLYTDLTGTPMVIGVMPVKEMSGTLYCFESLEEELGNIYRLRNTFILIAIAIIVVLIILINYIVKNLLHQFYDILHSIREVQKGDLDVVITDCGPDEMGELGTQINTMLRRIKQLMEDNVNREILARNSEIRALQNQINAHFIYNVLESIKMMAEIDEKYEISDAVTALGKLLRYSMRWSSDYVTVNEELEYIKNYLTLINLRFDYEIILSIKMPESIKWQKIPKMSLQPIVENAIYHGIEQLAEDTSIYVKGIVTDTDCIIEITDAGKGMSEEEVQRLYRKISGEIETNGGSGNGIGLKNVQDRIKMSFGEQYGIEILSKLGCYTKIMVRIPMNVTKWN